MKVSAVSTLLAGSAADERANVATALLGLVLAIIAALGLMAYAAWLGEPWRIGSALVFSATLVFLHLASTLYHAQTDPQRKPRLKVLDHCAIYLLIAGTYTPFTLIGLRDGVGWPLFAAIWSLALAGLVFKLFFTGRFVLVSTLIYIAMGWLVLIAIKPVYAALDGWTFGWIVAGGVAYTFGTLFYLQKGSPRAHAIWHLFVIAGGLCHVVAVASQLAATP